MTIRIFEHNAYQQSCEAVIEAIDDDGAIILDQTIFYPEGGGQPGDSGQITTEDGIVVAIADTQKAPDGQLVRHLPFKNVPSWDASGLAVGQTVKLAIDWQRRLCHMRMHTALHLLCALLPHSVTGCQIGAAKSRMDFDP
ncbi:MAG: alanyl-tRNA editing protein, partial [Pseudomonadota bacterium]